MSKGLLSICPGKKRRQNQDMSISNVSRVNPLPILQRPPLILLLMLEVMLSEEEEEGPLVELMLVLLKMLTPWKLTSIPIFRIILLLNFLALHPGVLEGEEELLAVVVVGPLVI